MKINRFIALGAIALLIVGAMSVIAARSFAQGSAPLAATEEVEDPASGPDTDDIQEQVGQQIEDGQPDGAEAPGAPDSSVQEPIYTGSVTVDEVQTESTNESDEAVALQGKATISSADAESAALKANPSTTVVKTELDNENGTLVYSVELSNGADVKVDAGNGSILFTDNGDDSEG
jgi:uncharacterized membrane protein YkoI